MRGEYKTPGGKLVAVEFDVEDGRLTRARLTGDFFLYPEEAFDDIVAALNGLPVTHDEARIARAIEAATPEGTEMLGFSPEAIAIAARRAMEIR